MKAERYSHVPKLVTPPVEIILTLSEDEARQLKIMVDWHLKVVKHLRAENLSVVADCFNSMGKTLFNELEKVRIGSYASFQDSCGADKEGGL